MIVNGESLASSGAMSPLHQEKRKFNGVSYGLGEAGYDVRIAQDVWLFPFRRFRLASTVERFTMPDDILGIVHDKSTWARKGLSVFNTVIEPGWEGWLTLELVYHGWRPLFIENGTGIAQVVFHELVHPAQYNGKYQGQDNRPVPAIMES